MKISRFDHGCFTPRPVCPPRLDHHRHDHGHCHPVREPECSWRRPDRYDACDRVGDPCEYPNLRYDEHLRRENLRAPWPQVHHPCGRVEDRWNDDFRAEGGWRRDGADGTRREDAMPRLGDIPAPESRRALERLVETYVIRALTQMGSRIDLYL